MGKKLGLEEEPKAKMHIDLRRTAKRQAMMAYMDSGLKNSPPSEMNWLSKWTDTYKKQMYPDGWPKEKPQWSRKTL